MLIRLKLDSVPPCPKPHIQVAKKGKGKDQELILTQKSGKYGKWRVKTEEVLKNLNYRFPSSVYGLGFIFFIEPRLTPDLSNLQKAVEDAIVGGKVGLVDDNWKRLPRTFSIGIPEKKNPHIEILVAENVSDLFQIIQYQDKLVSAL